MSRDLADYEKRYRELGYEAEQVRFRKRAMKDVLPALGSARVLEIGCGLSPFFSEVASFGHWTAVEPIESFFRNAENVKGEHPLADKITLVHSTIEAATGGLAKGGFDIIILSSLLHEIGNQKDFLGVCRSLMSEKTILHVNVPNAKSFHRVLALEAGLITDLTSRSGRQDSFQQNEVFDEESLRALVESAGFSVVKSGSFILKPFTHTQMEKLIAAKILTPELLEGLYKMSARLPGWGSEIFVNAERK